MIVFDGKVDEKNREYTFKRIQKHTTIITIIAGLIVAVGSLTIYWVAKFDYAIIGCIVALLGILLAPFLNMFDKKGKQNLDPYFPLKITIDDSGIELDNKHTGGYKSLQDVKKIVDCGDYYVFIFYNTVDAYYVCQKDLIKEGTIEEFEQMFDGMIERKGEKVAENSRIKGTEPVELSLEQQEKDKDS